MNRCVRFQSSCGQDFLNNLIVIIIHYYLLMWEQLLCVR